MGESPHATCNRAFVIASNHVAHVGINNFNAVTCGHQEFIVHLLEFVSVVTLFGFSNAKDKTMTLSETVKLYQKVRQTRNKRQSRKRR